jgi:hypothetical protein
MCLHCSNATTCAACPAGQRLLKTGRCTVGGARSGAGGGGRGGRGRHVAVPGGGGGGWRRRSRPGRRAGEGGSQAPFGGACLPGGSRVRTASRAPSGASKAAAPRFATGVLPPPARGSGLGSPPPTGPGFHAWAPDQRHPPPPPPASTRSHPARVVDPRHRRPRVGRDRGQPGRGGHMGLRSRQQRREGRRHQPQGQQQGQRPQVVHRQCRQGARDLRL